MKQFDQAGLEMNFAVFNWDEIHVQRDGKLLTRVK